ncbi:MAG TPA: Spy/CpxP family protein refolding chaperone [Candidatus Marinimicrobia bacterium]|nr:Spy/CpxP family protein refolding chaperone [Candidatus Neomarinimicrobiota bacterium]HRS51809.1 Spy/CpxP family protein refolding chaperone [Candidatus Neomarinimicrobiota bacterium]HRU92639.1 Spy/CpxP family protein refolding chaperone [Candidatus Neomarinimicrobiota bacterium]
MKKNFILGLILLTIPALIMAQPAVKGRTEPCQQALKGAQETHCQGQCKAPMADLLKLTDQQKVDHKKIMVKYQRLNIPLQADLKLAHLDLKEAIENLDQKKIDESVKKINDTKAKLFKNKIDQRVEFLKTLTDEQRKILKEQPCGIHKVKKIKRMEYPSGLGSIGAELDDLLGLVMDFDDGEMEIEPED